MQARDSLSYQTPHAFPTNTQFVSGVCFFFRGNKIFIFEKKKKNNNIINYYGFKSGITYTRARPLIFVGVKTCRERERESYFWSFFLFFQLQNLYATRVYTRRTPQRTTEEAIFAYISLFMYIYSFEYT